MAIRADTMEMIFFIILSLQFQCPFDFCAESIMPPKSSQPKKPTIHE
jgi:hypothetical protein